MDEKHRAFQRVLKQGASYPVNARNRSFILIGAPNTFVYLDNLGLPVQIYVPLP